MSPPGPENGKAAHPREAYGHSRKLNSDDKRKITDSTREGKLWPQLVLDLQSRNVPYTYRPAAHEVVVACPACGSELAIDAEQPFWLCLGSIRCEINRIPFSAVLKSLVEKVGGKR